MTPKDPDPNVRTSMARQGLRLYQERRMSEDDGLRLEKVGPEHEAAYLDMV